MQVELVLYGRRFSCSDQTRAVEFLTARNVPFRFIDIGADEHAARRLEAWVGYRSVPTLLIAQKGDVLPAQQPLPLDRNADVRGQNRGTMITEPSNAQLESFLKQHGFL